MKNPIDSLYGFGRLPWIYRLFPFLMIPLGLLGVGFVQPDGTNSLALMTANTILLLWWMVLKAFEDHFYIRMYRIGLACAGIATLVLTLADNTQLLASFSIILFVVQLSHTVAYILISYGAIKFDKGGIL